MTAPSIFVSACAANNPFSTASVTRYGGIMGSQAGVYIGNATATEAKAQCNTGTAGTLKNLYINVSINGRSATTFTVRQNGADSALTVQTTASTTGVYTDTSHSVAIAQGDLICLSATTGTGAGNITETAAGLTFTPSSGTTISVYSFDAAGVILSGTGPITDFIPFSGDLLGSTITEANAQILAQVAGTSKYMNMNVSTNGRSTSTVVTFRKNSGAGNQTFTYTSAQTGAKTDTSNTDTLSVNDLVCCSPALGTGTGNFIVTFAGFWFDSSTDGSFWTGSATGTGTGGVLTAGSTSYTPVGGILNLGGTEANLQGETGTAGTASKLWCYVTTNASTTNATLKFRNGSSTKNQVVTITNLTTGPFQDTTHSDAFLATDLINFIAAGATTGNVTFSAVTVLIATTVIATATGGTTLPTMGVG